MTRAEYHAESDAATVRQSRARVRAALERNAVGQTNAMSGSELAALTPLKATTVRDIIAELRDDPKGPPIANCSDGYYVIADVSELQAWVEDVNDEIQTKENRKQANVKSFNRRHYAHE